MASAYGRIILKRILKICQYVKSDRIISLKTEIVEDFLITFRAAEDVKLIALLITYTNGILHNCLSIFSTCENNFTNFLNVQMRNILGERKIGSNILY